MTDPALAVDEVRVRYGAVQAVRGVSLSVNAGSILTILGANGAGKTSLLRGISGLVSAKGSVALRGRNLTSVDAAGRARAGLGHVLEGRQIFPDMTVAENMRLGTGTSADPQSAIESALALLPELTSMWSQKAGRLSGGQQQMLAIARALSGTPTALLLDEPTNGLAPLLVTRTIEVIRAVCEMGVAVLLVEQRLEVAQVLQSDVLILQRGQVIGAGNGREDDLEDRIHAAYLA